MEDETKFSQGSPRQNIFVLSLHFVQGCHEFLCRFIHIGCLLKRNRSVVIRPGVFHKLPSVIPKNHVPFRFFFPKFIPKQRTDVAALRIDDNVLVVVSEEDRCMGLCKVTYTELRNVFHLGLGTSIRQCFWYPFNNRPMSKDIPVRFSTVQSIMVELSFGGDVFLRQIEDGNTR